MPTPDMLTRANTAPLSGTDLTSLSVSQLVSLRDDVRQELLHRQGSPLQCAQCGREFFARQNARFCSGRCRVASFRAVHARPRENQ